MPNKKLFIISFLIIIFIVVLHYFSLKNSWYWNYRWLDIPVHIIAGFGVSLMALWLSLKIRHIDNIYGYKKKALLVMLITVFILAIFWEIYELVIKFTSLNNISYWKDASLDIFNSLVGGVIAFLYFIRNKKAKCLVADIKHPKNFAVTLSTN